MQPRHWRSDGTITARRRGRSEVNTYPGAPQWSVQLADIDSALGCARREVWRVVDGWGLGQVADVVELLALELVSVAMGGSGPHVVESPGYRELLRVWSLGLRFQLEAWGLVIATWDEDPRSPRFKQPGTGPAADGRALYYVPMLAEVWDYFRSGNGKVVWAEVRSPSAGERWLPRRGRTLARQPTVPLIRDIALLERVPTD